MSDLVERLRGLDATHTPFGAAHEAADRIEELEAAARLALEALETLMLERGSIYDEAITALRRELEKL